MKIVAVEQFLVQTNFIELVQQGVRLHPSGLGKVEGVLVKSENNRQVASGIAYCAGKIFPAGGSAMLR